MLSLAVNAHRYKSHSCVHHMKSIILLSENTIYHGRITHVRARVLYSRISTFKDLDKISIIKVIKEELEQENLKILT